MSRCGWSARARSSARALSVIVVGLEQHQVPLDVLERVAIAEDDLGKVVAGLRDRANLAEVVVLSTCMRTEVYAVVERFHEGVTDLQEFLATMAGTPVETLEDRWTVFFDDAVTGHLFEVAAGLRSSVLGETEVLGQVRRALERAQAEHANGPVLSTLFRHAVQAGRHVRSTTAIAQGSTSLSHVAVELAASRLGGSLAGRHVVVVGAGEMGEGMVDALGGHGDLAQVVVANRTVGRASTLAARVGGNGVGLAGLGDGAGHGRRRVRVDRRVAARARRRAARPRRSGRAPSAAGPGAARRRRPRGARATSTRPWRASRGSTCWTWTISPSTPSGPWRGAGPSSPPRRRS